MPLPPDIQKKIDAGLLQVIREVNAQLPKPGRLEESLGERLSGKGCKLDSLGLVNFLVLTEHVLERELGRRLSLTSVMEADESYLTDVRALSRYVFEILSRG